uniref:Uncharacterized protein n=1 Tax=Odontella aurita TaxID=265563 RepID=A0A7S4JB68_9STRA|mmetsp:Transcript_42786/g.130084  ORF Transcript_42786/g.130084 Transcript_42786/m.130084 type:complete len:358 (+) Transcript_42786:67-1140(+)
MRCLRRSIAPAAAALLSGGTALLLQNAARVETASAFVHPSASLPSISPAAGPVFGAASSSRPRAVASALFAKKKKKKGGKNKKGGGANKKESGFEWASSFTLKPFESKALRELASTTMASFEGRTGRSLCEEMVGAEDVPKALWNAPTACVVVGPPAAAEEGSSEAEASEGEEGEVAASGPGTIVKYANAAALETVGLKPDEFEKFINPTAATVDGAVYIDLPPVMKGDKKYEGGYKKKILRGGDSSEGEGNDVTVLHAQRWTIEKSVIIGGKFVTETTGVAYSWSEWALGEDTLCSAGGKRGPLLRPEDLEEAVEAQAAAVRALKQEEGLGNKDPKVVEAVGELLRLKGLLEAANA